jgi:hypothetical protein
VQLPEEEAQKLGQANLLFTLGKLQDANNLLLEVVKVGLWAWPQNFIT